MPDSGRSKWYICFDDDGNDAGTMHFDVLANGDLAVTIRQFEPDTRNPSESEIVVAKLKLTAEMYQPRGLMNWLKGVVY